MVRRALFLLLIAFAAAPYAGVYRWVDADGRVHFSDRPGADAVSERFAIPGQQSTSEAEEDKLPPPPSSPEAAYLGVYRVFEIAAPQADATLIQESTDVPVSVFLDPSLRSGHRMEVLVDGAPSPLSGQTTQFKLTKLGPGSHRLQLRIYDADNRMVARTAAQSFHLRKPQQLGVLR